MTITPEEFGKGVASHFVKTMSEPKNQGPKFTMDKLPEIAAGNASVTYFLHTTHDVTKDEERRAAEAARAEVQRILEAR